VSFNDARSLLDSLEPALKEALNKEEERLEKERDFLLAVKEGIGSQGVEASSDEKVDFRTIGLLSKYFPDTEG